MEKVRRILVHMAKESSVPECARFVQSITGHFADSETDVAEVSCSLENNRFILYGQDGGKGRPAVPLKRASFCPFKHMSKSEAAALPASVLSRGVDVGVAVLLQSANQKLLLTRRAAGLSIFPNVWVPPGGHIEFDEKLLDAGLRELREETGLKIDDEDISSELLGLWEVCECHAVLQKCAAKPLPFKGSPEPHCGTPHSTWIGEKSVYPPMLSRGLPRRHHIVTYILLNTSLTHQQLEAALRPEPGEVSGCLWVDAEIVKGIVSAVDGEEGAGKLPESLPQTVGIWEVSPEGRLCSSVLPVSVLCSRAPAAGEDVERVSTGTKFALELWLKTLEARS